MIADKAIIDYLTTATSANVYAEIPTPTPAAFVTVEIIGRGMSNRIEQCTAEVVCYGKSKYTTAALDEIIRQNMPGIIYNKNFYSCKLGGGICDIDETNKMYRYRTQWNLYF